MLANCLSWEPALSCPVALVLFWHSQYPSQRPQNSSYRKKMRCLSELATQALCWVGSGVQGGMGTFLSFYDQCCFPNVLTPDCLWLASSPIWTLHHNLPQPLQTPQAAACPTVNVWFDQLHPPLAVTQVWLSSSNALVTTRSLSEQSGTSSGSGKPSQALSIAQLGTCWYLIIMW